MTRPNLNTNINEIKIIEKKSIEEIINEKKGKINEIIESFKEKLSLFDQAISDAERENALDVGGYGGI
jgi:hypothetical protein